MIETEGGIGDTRDAVTREEFQNLERMISKLTEVFMTSGALGSNVGTSLNPTGTAGNPTDVAVGPTERVVGPTVEGVGPTTDTMGPAANSQHGIGAGSSSLNGMEDCFEADDLGAQIYAREDFIHRRGVRPDSVKVLKFDGTDFNIWKHSMTIYLNIADLIDVVTGDYVKPVNNTEELRKWNRLNYQAIGVLIGALSREQHQLVTHCDTASQIWSTLEETYMRRSTAHKGQLLEEYESYRMGRGVSMEKYIMDVKRMQEKLRGVGLTLDDEMKVIKLLRGLNETYAMDRKILMNVPGLNFEEACGRLLSEAQMGKVTEGKVPVANLSVVSGETAWKARVKRRCYNCNSESHLSSSCPEVRKVPTVRKLTCFVCGSEKHRAFECPKKFRRSTAGAANVSQAGDSEVPGASS